LHRRLGLPQVPVKHFANGAERNGLIVALDQSAEPRDRALGQTVELALEREYLAVLTGARVKRRRAWKQSAATIAQRRSIVCIYFLRLHV
jgi:hypothetical protein